MSVTLEIAGVDKTSLLRINTINKQDVLNQRTTCSFRLVDTTASYRPQIGQSAVLKLNGTKIFGGIISNLNEASLHRSILWLAYDVVCVAYDQLFDRRRVAEIYENETVENVIFDIVDNFVTGESITTASVNASVSITKAIFNYRKASDCLDELAELIGYSWYVDFDKDLNFFERSANTAPFALTDTSGNYRNIQVIKNIDDYRNTQYVRAGQDITDPRTENFVGDDARRSWTLKYPVAKVPSAITVGTSSQTVGIFGVETGKDFYWNKGEKQIVQDDSGTTLSSTDNLDITYQGLFPIIVQAIKDTEISDRATIEGGSGIYEDVQDELNIDVDDYAEERAVSLLRKYGEIQTRVEFETDTYGLKAGQLISITNTIHNLNETFLISNVYMSDLTQEIMRYQVTALSGEKIGGWVDFFKKMTQQQQQFVIRENEVLLRLRQFKDNLKSVETFSASSAAPLTRVGTAIVGFSEVGA